MAKIIGMGGNITVSSTAYAVQKWDGTTTNEVQDVTDTGSSGWVARITGVSSMEVTATMFWGASATTITTVFAQGSNISATLNIGSTSETYIGSFYVSSVKISNDAKTPVTVEVTLMSTGIVTQPS